MIEKHGITHGRSQVIDYAYSYAKAAHEGQTRRYTFNPYITHPIAVAKAVASVTEDCDAIAAAFLHDTVEDCDVTFGDINREFGFRTCCFVKEMTEFSVPADGNRAFRKNLDLRYLTRACPLVKTIKIADLIDNSESIIAYSPDFASVFVGEMENLLDVLGDGDKSLMAKARAIVSDYRDRKPLAISRARIALANLDKMGGVRKSFDDLINELKSANNPVTYWALNECVVDRIKRRDFS